MKNEDITLEEQVERLRARRGNSEEWKDRVRRILNNVFLILTACGAVTYVSGDANRGDGMILFGIAIGFKLVEIIIRILR